MYSGFDYSHSSCILFGPAIPISSYNSFYGRDGPDMQYITQDCLDCSPLFEYISTPFCSVHVCGSFVSCFVLLGQQLIMGVYSAFCKWVCLIRHFVIIILCMLIMCCHDEVM